MTLFAALKDRDFGRGRALAWAAVLLPLPTALGALLVAPSPDYAFAVFGAGIAATAFLVFYDGFLKNDRLWFEATIPAFYLPGVPLILLRLSAPAAPTLILAGAALWLVQLLLLLRLAFKIERQMRADLEEFAKGYLPSEEP